VEVVEDAAVAADEDSLPRVVGLLRVGEWTVEMTVWFPEGEIVALTEAPDGTAATDTTVVVETTVKTEEEEATEAEEEAEEDDGAGVLEGVALVGVCSAYRMGR